MKEQELKRIADELSRLNQNFEKLINQLSAARRKIEDLNVPSLGSTGEFGKNEPSTK